MPELPEVETLCRQLDSVLSDAVLQSAVVYDQRLPGVPVPGGRRVQSVRRSGKSVAIHFDGSLTLLIHLRMTGRLCWKTRQLRPPYSRCVIVFDAGRLYLVDPRRFATVSLKGASTEKVTVIDPMEEWNGQEFLRRSVGRRLPVKNFLMDQKTIGGIGNIYACEVLHRAGISPWRRACDLDEKRWKRVSKALKAILAKAIECRGTTISDWADLFDQKGLYQKYLRVYGRTGKPCPRCGAPVIRTLLGGRATFFCTSCQET
jgi:formamidopyrimidine-DNA glycosylase